MSPEPPEAPAASPPARLLGFPWSEWQRAGLEVWFVVFCANVLVMSATALWITRGLAGPTLWDIRLLLVEGGAYFVCGHAALALRVAASDPAGRKRMVQAAVDLMLSGLAVATAGGFLWLIMPEPRLGSAVILPHWVGVVDQAIAGYLLLVGTLGAAAGFGTAGWVIYGDWSRPPSPPSASVPSPRPRFLVDQN